MHQRQFYLRLDHRRARNKAVRPRKHFKYKTVCWPASLQRYRGIPFLPSCHPGKEGCALITLDTVPHTWGCQVSSSTSPALKFPLLSEMVLLHERQSPGETLFTAAEAVLMLCLWAFCASVNPLNVHDQRVRTWSTSEQAASILGFLNLPHPSHHHHTVI